MKSTTMKTGDLNKVCATKTTVASEAKVRKSLHVLQPAATDKENLVGAGRQLRSTVQTKEPLKEEAPVKKKVESSKSKKSLKDKAVQTTRGGKIQIEVEDLTSEAGPSENYWQVLAERRRITLEDVLEENRHLSERVAQLEEEKKVYKEMLDESRALVEVLQDMIGEDRNDINNSLEDSTL